ncbi:lysylphosphatidylglycerol synthetase/glycosyltransferase agld [Lucifera butyrica]|uniref:Phosphatidylglycerol lysyltransferase n=1 Tax=Lucifera butyrica TaxID=1351585 RepID=A0A498R9A6_9FIRM|nr:lysylphosphatidylglycerol synthase transmembrane domain-containing protein [Lucifera butyrica]VBB06852.1 lysylphosphatidylglycerol synthetase/glycosyltransferase agld [Lucifera butyrica]
MNKFYKRLTVLFLLIAGISAAVVYYTVDIHTLKSLNVFRPWSLVAALLLLALGMYFDGTRLMHLVRISGERISLYQGVQVIFSNYFLAVLTPGAAGGAVAQVMFLRRAGVPTGKATVVVLVRTILSILFLLVCQPLIFFYDPGLVPWISERTLVAASTLLIAGIVAGIWLFRTRIPNYLLIRLTKKLQPDRRRRIFLVYRDVRGAVFLLASAPGSMLRVFVESAASLVAMYSMVPVLFMGIGAAFNWWIILGRMIFLNVILYFAPTPGGSGVAEGGFVLLFGNFLPPGTVGILAVAWRILAEYLPFSIGLYFTVKTFGRDFITRELK